MKQKIFILHGWAYETEKWDPFVDLLKEKFEPVLLKIPGLTTPLDEIWKLDDYVEWLKEKIGNDLPAGRQEKVILLGHSNGGRISLAFTLKYPEKVLKIILIDSAGIFHNEFSIRAKKFIFGTLAKIGKNLKNVQVIKSVFYKLVREHDYEKANPTLRETMRNLINSDLSDVLKQIKTPTIIIWGRSDKITPLKDGQFMNQEIKDSKLFVVDARHSPQFTNAKEVVEIIYGNL